MFSITIISERIEDCRKIQNIIREYNRLSRKPFLNWEYLSRKEDWSRACLTDIFFYRIDSEKDYEYLCQIRSRYVNAELVLMTSKDCPSSDQFIVPEIRPLLWMKQPLEEEYLRVCMKRICLCLFQEEEGKDFSHRFILRYGSRRHAIPYSSITFFETRNKRIVLHTSAREYEFYDSFARMEDCMPAQFVRCHRSYIINVIHISCVDLEHLEIVLDSGQDIPISRKYRSRVEDLLYNHILQDKN